MSTTSPCNLSYLFVNQQKIKSDLSVIFQRLDYLDAMYSSMLKKNAPETLAKSDFSLCNVTSESSIRPFGTSTKTTVNSFSSAKEIEESMFKKESSLTSILGKKLPTTKISEEFETKNIVSPIFGDQFNILDKTHASEPATVTSKIALSRDLQGTSMENMNNKWIKLQDISESGIFVQLEVKDENQCRPADTNENKLAFVHPGNEAVDKLQIKSFASKSCKRPRGIDHCYEELKIESQKQNVDQNLRDIQNVVSEDNKIGCKIVSFGSTKAVSVVEYYENFEKDPGYRGLKCTRCKKILNKQPKLFPKTGKRGRALAMYTHLAMKHFFAQISSDMCQHYGTSKKWKCTERFCNSVFRPNDIISLIHHCKIEHHNLDKYFDRKDVEVLVDNPKKSIESKAKHKNLRRKNRRTYDQKPKVKYPVDQEKDKSRVNFFASTSSYKEPTDNENSYQEPMTVFQKQNFNQHAHENQNATVEEISSIDNYCQLMVLNKNGDETMRFDTQKRVSVSEYYEQFQNYPEYNGLKCTRCYKKFFLEKRGMKNTLDMYIHVAKSHLIYEITKDMLEHYRTLSKWNCPQKNCKYIGKPKGIMYLIDHCIEKHDNLDKYFRPKDIEVLFKEKKSSKQKFQVPSGPI